MRGITEMINEASMQFWFVTNIDTNVSYIVCANSAEEAKGIIPEDGEKLAWMIKLKKTAGPTILFDSEQVKQYGDKKW